MTEKTPIYKRFEGKTVLVTGAGTGFGSAIAFRAAQEGARVGVHYNRSREGAEAIAERVRGIGGEAEVFQADISSWDAVRDMADAAWARFGTLDVLVNNVGDVATEQMSWRDVTQELIDRVIDVDIKGTMYMLHEFGSRMLDQGGGAIVNIGSTVIVRGSPRAPQYAAGKYGVLGLTKSYANALAPTVRVNAFAPGFMETEATLAREDWQTGRREKLVAATPAGRIPPPEDLAATALFLATEEAAHMFGAYLVADGGYNMIGA
ncbi:MAG TPA: SDR family oxidoreductase [Acidimicrobiia bacterium]|nr:SDR family oxidoreductase [Acidimicrobiia bacterium]